MSKIRIGRALAALGLGALAGCGAGDQRPIPTRLERRTRMIQERLAGLTLPILLCLVAAGCGRTPPPSGEPDTKVAFIDLAPVDPEVFVGGSLRLEAYPTDSTGLDLEGRQARWWSGDEKVATVNSSGLVHGVAVGKTVIAVDVEGVQASVLLRVAPAPIGRVLIEPESLDLVQGRWTRLRATAVDIWGEAMEVGSFEWNSSAPEIVQVDGEGRVEALQPGMATIFASTSGVEASANVLVRENPVAKVVPETTLLEIYTGRSRQLSATALDEEGNLVPDARISWHSKDPQIASVEGSGLLRAWRPGLVALVAAAGSVEATVKVVVLQMEVVRVELPPTARVIAEEKIQLAPTIIGSDGELLFGKQVQWSSSDPAIASVDGAGEVTGHAIGEVTISASVEGTSASCVVTVDPPPPYLVRIEVEPSMWLREGESAPFPVVGIDQYGEPMNDVYFLFNSSNPWAVSVHGEVAYGWKAGSAAITTSARSVKALTTIVVLPPLEVGEVEIHAENELLILGETEELKVIVWGVDGIPLNPWPVSWTSSDPSIATVEDGVVKGVGVGEVTITATADGVWDEVQLRVEALRFQQVDVADRRSCGLTVDGRIFCWGFAHSSLGGSQPYPALMEAPFRFRQISVGDQHICAIATPGDLAYCLGIGNRGQLGGGTTTTQSTFSPVAGGHRFAEIAAGVWQSCGVTLDGAGYCWGTGPLGAGEEVTQSLSPVSIGGALDLEEIAISSTNPSVYSSDSAVSCGITTDQRAYCWGANGKGGLGDGTTTFAHVPIPVSGGLRFTAIAPTAAIGSDEEGQRILLGHSCGLSDTGQAYCWGWNGLGQLGDGSVDDSLVPRQVAGTERFIQIEASTTSEDALSCGITTELEAMCWGSNRFFVLGPGGTTSSKVPVPVPGGRSFTSLALGAYHVCALDPNGLIYCWGRSDSGQIGIPNPPPYVVAPVPVFGQLPPSP